MRHADHLASNPTDSALPFLMLTQGHLARWQGHCLARMNDPAAIGLLTEGQADAADSIRAVIGLETDLALALNGAGRTAEADDVAKRAGALAALHGSRRQRRRLAPLLPPIQREEMQDADQSA
jgi:hypothetical protein